MRYRRSSTGQSTDRIVHGTCMQLLAQERLVPKSPDRDAPVRPPACAPAGQLAVVPRVQLILHPFTPCGGFWLTTVSSIAADDGPGFVLHTVTRLHGPGLRRYYGLICHLTPTGALGFPLISCFQKKKNSGLDARLPRLLHRLPVRYSILKHCTQLTEYWASHYFACLPPRTAESGSLTLCTPYLLWLPSDPTVGQ